MKQPMKLEDVNPEHQEKVKEFILSWKNAYDRNPMIESEYHDGRYKMLKQMLGEKI